MNAPVARPAVMADLRVAGEYLGTDREGNEYFTRGGHVYAVDEASPEGLCPAVCGRGRFSAFNRLSRRHPVPANAA